MIKDKPRSSHFGWYEEDYEDMYWEEGYGNEQRGHHAYYYGAQREDKPPRTRTKKEEDYPPMPAASSKPSSAPPQPVSDVGENHWVNKATESRAPSSSGRGRRGGGKGRQNRDEEDDSYRPSMPSTGYSLGDWFDDKLAIKDKPRSYSNEPRGHHVYGARKEEKPVGARTKKEAWLEEEYPPMPAASSKPPSGPQQPVSDMGESHWDWVGMATGSGAPSSARKQ